MKTTFNKTTIRNLKNHKSIDDNSNDSLDENNLDDTNNKSTNNKSTNNSPNDNPNDNNSNDNKSNDDKSNDDKSNNDKSNDDKQNNSYEINKINKWLRTEIDTHWYHYNVINDINAMITSFMTNYDISLSKDFKKDLAVHMYYNSSENSYYQ